MSGAMSRNKGSTYEREVARALDLALGIRFERDLDQVRKAAHGDLLPSDRSFPFTIECKRRASGSGCEPAWQSQASAAAAAAGTFPAVIYRFDRRDTRVSVPLAAAWGAAPANEWVEMSLEAFCFIAREMMADDSWRRWRREMHPDLSGIYNQMVQR